MDCPARVQTARSFSRAAVLMLATLVPAALGLARPASAQFVVREFDELSVLAFRDDAASLAMGSAYVADGRGYNAYFHNPAIAGRAPHDLEVFHIGLTIGDESIEGARFLDDNQDRFDGLEQEFADAVAAVQQGQNQPMNDFLTFVDAFLDLFEDPVGGRVQPGFTVRHGRFTFGLYGEVQAAMEEVFDASGGQVNLLRELSRIRFPLDQADVDRLEELLNELQNDNATLSTIVGLGVADVVGAVSYAQPVRPGLTVGVTGKVVNRRVGLRLLEIDNFDEPYQQSLDDIRQSATRVGIDVGALYEFDSMPLSVGLAIRDLIATEANINENEDGIEFADLAAFQEELARNGFTSFIVEDPSPIVVTLGASYAIGPALRANLDLFDLANQVEVLDTVGDHLRLGVEFAAQPWLMLRGGLSASRPALGAGARLGPVELAYALYEDDLLQRYAHRVQLRIAP